jgi:hypothetical protein
MRMKEGPHEEFYAFCLYRHPARFRRFIRDGRAYQPVADAAIVDRRPFCPDQPVADAAIVGHCPFCPDQPVADAADKIGVVVFEIISIGSRRKQRE